MPRQQKQMLCDVQAQLRSTVFGEISSDRNPDLVCVPWASAGVFLLARIMQIG